MKKTFLSLLSQLSYSTLIILCLSSTKLFAQDKGSCTKTYDRLTIFANYDSADAKYDDKKLTWTPTAKGTINTYAIVNSGNSGRIGFDLSTQGLLGAGANPCIKNSDREIRLFPSSLGACDWDNGIVASVSDGGNKCPWSNPEFYNLSPNTDYIVQVKTIASSGCEVNEQYLTCYKLLNVSKDMNYTICSGETFATASKKDTTYSWSTPIVSGSMSGGASGINQTTISGTLSNSTNTIQTATYTVTSISNGSACATFKIIVTVNPTPSINSITNSICSGGIFTCSPANGANGVVPVGTTYSWRAPNVTIGMIGGAAGTSLLNISGSITNPTNTIQTAIYTVTPKANTCVGSTFMATITVNPIPYLNSTLSPSTINSGSTFIYSPTSATPGATFSCSRATIAGIQENGIFGMDSISEILTNTTANPINVTYTITTSANACVNSGENVSVTVNKSDNLLQKDTVAHDTTGIKIDNVITVSIDTCVFNYNAPLDSFKITGYSIVQDKILLHIAFYQNPNVINVSATIPLTAIKEGNNLLKLTIQCTTNKSLSNIYKNVFITNFNYLGTTGIKKATETKMEVFPNPTSGMLTILLPSNIKAGATLELYTIDSKKLLSQKASQQTNVLDMSAYPTGVYLLKVVSEEGVMIEKVIKN